MTSYIFGLVKYSSFVSKMFHQTVIIINSYFAEARMRVGDMYQAHVPQWTEGSSK